jgi:hypothetical protein
MLVVPVSGALSSYIHSLEILCLGSSLVMPPVVVSSAGEGQSNTMRGIDNGVLSGDFLSVCTFLMMH